MPTNTGNVSLLNNNIKRSRCDNVTRKLATMKLCNIRTFYEFISFTYEQDYMSQANNFKHKGISQNIRVHIAMPAKVNYAVPAYGIANEKRHLNGSRALRPHPNNFR